MDRIRLDGRILMMTAVVPPVPLADAFVVKGLVSQFDADEVVLAAERWPANPAEQTEAPSGHRVHFISRRLDWPKRGRKYFEWLKWLTVPRSTWRLIKLAKAGKCTAIFTHFPDEQFLCSAYLASRWLALPLFPFFHNTYRENRQGIAYCLATWLQLRVFRAAPVVFVMSEGMQNELQQLYPEQRFLPLVHTFEGEVPQFEPLPPVDPAKVQLGYLGSVNETNLDALRRLRTVVGDLPNTSLNIYSGSPGWFLEKQRLLGSRVRHEQPSDEVLQMKLRENDILLLPHGLRGGLSPIEYLTIFPTRTIPYLLSGRPILAHSPQDSFLTQWLRRHDCAEIVDVPDEAALRAAIARLCDDTPRRDQLVRNALKAARQFHAPRVVDALKRTINELSRPSTGDGAHRMPGAVTN
jgi:glycosyltransferase involved in cell wall biosynthesis